MARLGDKYIAGFLDADGSIGCYIRNRGRPNVTVTFAQNTDQDEVIHRIHEELGVGKLTTDRVSNMGTRYSTLTLSASNAVGLLNRVKKHLVVKRHFAEVVIDLSTRMIERDEIPVIQEYIKTHKFMRSTPLPVHPSRSWTAGYLDGDGCFSVTKLSKLGPVANLVLHVAGDARKTEGIELLHKAYGGNIYDMRNGKCKQWVLLLDPSKVKSLLSEFAKRMVVKADQAYFLLGCAKMGHFRDGKNIKAGLKHLKAQPHRLNEPKVDLPALLATVQDLPKPKRQNYGLFFRDKNGRIAGKRAA